MAIWAIELGSLVNVKFLNTIPGLKKYNKINHDKYYGDHLSNISWPGTKTSQSEWDRSVIKRSEIKVEFRPLGRRQLKITDGVRELGHIYRRWLVP